MSPAVALSVAIYAFTMSITPGPNNTMLLASGVNFGLRPTIPHISGITFGFTAMLLAVGLGLGGLFAAVPMLHTLLKLVGTAYLLYLAWRIATADTAKSSDSSKDRPLTFLQAALFQWVNPKAWVIAIGAAATYIPQQGYLWNLIIASLIVCLVMSPCIAAWAGAGVVLRRFLNEPHMLRIFNITMALLLVASLYPVLKS